MKIQQVESLTQLSSHTLRYYEKIGLIQAVARDTRGYRWYSDQDLVWIEFIKRLKATQMPLTEIKRFAHLRTLGDSSMGERLEILRRHRERIDRQIDQLQSHRNKLDEKIALCQRGGPLT